MRHIKILRFTRGVGVKREINDSIRKLAKNFLLYKKDKFWLQINLIITNICLCLNFLVTVFLLTTVWSRLLLLIHEADPQSRPVVLDDIVFAHVVRPYFRPSPLYQTKQISSENNVRHWRDCGSGRVDHWWHLSCYNSLLPILVRFLLGGRRRREVLVRCPVLLEEYEV